MGKQKFCTLTLLGAFIFLFIFALKTEASNFFPVMAPNNKGIEQFQNILQKLCTMRVKIHNRFPRFPVPRICKTKNTKPPVLEFYAEPQSITEGESATLSWASDNTVSCEASGGWLGEKTLSGEEAVSPLVTTIYTLSCDGVKKGAEKSVTVEVVPLPPLPEPKPTPTLNFTANPELIIQNQSSSTLSWNSQDALSCEASGGWSGDKALFGEEIVSPLATTTYTLTCNGEGGGVEKNVAVNVLIPIPEPEPTLSHIIISEVYYDVDNAHGVEPSNEWIEVYNGTGSSVDVSGWGVYDGGTSGSDSIPNGTIIPDNSFLLITGSSTTASKWPGQTFVVLRSIIGGGLANGGDAVLIKDLASSTVDAMSYGSNTSVFTLPVPVVSDGHSFRRINLTIDTDTASDWEDSAIPTPGY